jgi:hypothetical protein
VELAAVPVAVAARVTLPAEDRPEMPGALEPPEVPVLAALVARTQVAAVAVIGIPLAGQAAVVL